MIRFSCVTFLLVGCSREDTLENALTLLTGYFNMMIMSLEKNIGNATKKIVL